MSFILLNPAIISIETTESGGTQNVPNDIRTYAHFKCLSEDYHSPKVCTSQSTMYLIYRLTAVFTLSNSVIEEAVSIQIYVTEIEFYLEIGKQ